MPERIAMKPSWSLSTFICFSMSNLPLATVATAQTEDQVNQGVQQIIIAAENVCGQLSSSGSQSQMEIEGEAEAEVGRLTKRLLDIGIEGAGSLTEGEYSGVLREQLSEELKDNRRCRENIFNAMFTLVFGAAPETALNETQEEALEGRVRPHSIETLGPDIREFSMQVGESAKLLDDTYLITLARVNGDAVVMNWTRLAGKVESGYTRLHQGEAGDFYHCGITPYSQISYDQEIFSFLMNCDLPQ